MSAHGHREDPWRVRVDDERGTPRGAGVLLDDRHVLTCAHVVAQAGAAPGGAAPHVQIRSTVCHPEWTRTARIVPDSWVYRNGTRRGDVALLELDAPTPCGAATRLWQAPLSRGRVRAYGFPQIEPYGLAVDAELAGSGGREGEWGMLNRVHPDAQWIEPGYSGAGVVALDGEFAGRVIGIVVADYVNANGEAQAAWMLPTGTMLGYLRSLRAYVGGEPATVLPPPEDGSALHDSMRLALTRELAQLLSSDWSGTVVLTGGATGTGTSWLTRLVRTADPAARAVTSDAELSTAPQDTVLGLGSVDAAYDARGRSSAEIRQYLADRFGFDAREGDLVAALRRRRPPVCLVVCAVDRATDPDALVDSLLGPLARSALWRGCRLVLGFDGRPPAGLAYEISLGPDPVVAGAGGRATAAEAEQRVAELSVAEEEAARRHTEWGLRFFAPPVLPHRVAPQLRVQLAVAGDDAEPSREFAAIRDRATAALGEVERFIGGMDRRIRQREDLWQLLERHRERAERFFGAEDPLLWPLHSEAVRALWEVPIDLTAARTAVNRYVDEVSRRIERGGRTIADEV